MSTLRLSLVLVSGALLLVVGILLLWALMQAVFAGCAMWWLIGAVSFLVLAGLVSAARRWATVAVAQPPRETVTQAPVEITWPLLVGGVAVVLLGFTQFQFIALIHEGASYACLTAPNRAGADEGPVHAQMTVLSPSLVCHYPKLTEATTTIPVDLFPFDPWIYFACLIALNLTLLASLTRRPSGQGHRTPTHTTPPGPRTSLSGGSPTVGRPSRRVPVPAPELIPLLGCGAVLLLLGGLTVWSVTTTLNAPSWAHGLLSSFLLMAGARLALAIGAAFPPTPGTLDCPPGHALGGDGHGSTPRWLPLPFWSEG